MNLIELIELQSLQSIMIILLILIITVSLLNRYGYLSLSLSKSSAAAAAGSDPILLYYFDPITDNWLNGHYRNLIHSYLVFYSNHTIDQINEILHSAGPAVTNVMQLLNIPNNQYYISNNQLAAGNAADPLRIRFTDDLRLCSTLGTLKPDFEGEFQSNLRIAAAGTGAGAETVAVYPHYITKSVFYWSIEDDNDDDDNGNGDSDYIPFGINY